MHFATPPIFIIPMFCSAALAGCPLLRNDFKSVASKITPRRYLWLGIFPWTSSHSADNDIKQGAVLLRMV